MKASASPRFVASITRFTSSTFSCDIARGSISRSIASAAFHAKRNRFSSKALLPQREDRDWDSELANQLVEQSSFLPIGAVRSAEPDEDVVRVERGEGIL
jgi:hypothetical protein